jgi:hypothetical protein
MRLPSEAFEELAHRIEQGSRFVGRELERLGIRQRHAVGAHLPVDRRHQSPRRRAGVDAVPRGPIRRPWHLAVTGVHADRTRPRAFVRRRQRVLVALDALGGRRSREQRLQAGERQRIECVPFRSAERRGMRNQQVHGAIIGSRV